MRVAIAEDPEATALRDELAGRAMGTDAAGLMTANAWLWSVESASSDPPIVIAALLAHPELPGRAWLEPGIGSRRWASHSVESVAAVAVRLLTGGQSLEISAFLHEPDAAAQFVARSLAWVGQLVAAFGSTEYRPGRVSAGFGLYRVPHWFDEGLVLVGSQRAAMLWFVGTD